MKTPAILMAIAITGTMAACNNSSQNTNDSIPAADTGLTQGAAQDINKDQLASDSLSDDSKNVTKAAEDGMFEVKFSSAAATKATSASVKKLAQHMVDAHTKANNELMTLASQKGITLPTAISEGKEKDIADVMEKTGKDFDKEFVDKLISAHEDAIDLFEKTSENAKDPDIKAWFGKTLPELRKHLDMAKAEKDKLK